MANINDSINEQIKVYCRFKPSINDIKCVGANNNSCLYYNAASSNSNTKFPIKCMVEETSQIDLFDEIAKPLVDSVIQGYNSTILAYGQTNSGKRHMAPHFTTI